MCIGEISVTALILYPIRYLAPSNTASDATPATSTMPATCVVKLRYDASKKRMGSLVGSNSNDQTINIASPTTSAGPGEDFGVVDQKAANVLAPLMERGLIRTEARVVKGSENVGPFPCLVITCSFSFGSPLFSLSKYYYLHPREIYLQYLNTSRASRSTSNTHVFPTILPNTETVLHTITPTIHLRGAIACAAILVLLPPDDGITRRLQPERASKSSVAKSTKSSRV
jgi:hypothetical protein